LPLCHLTPIASAAARFCAKVSNISPKDRSYPHFLLPDPGQKGVDGLRWIGYYFVNSIWQSEILN
jgi:hypothetical protein